MAPGTGFTEDNFSMDWGRGGGGEWFQDDSSTLHLAVFYFSSNATTDLTGSISLHPGRLGVGDPW